MSNTVKKFGMSDKVGYAFGDLGNDLTFVLSAAFLLKYYTDVMSVPVALVGAMMMIARIVDAFADVIMGQIVDRSRTTAKGKFAPWIRRMCGPVAVASILAYPTWFQNMSMEFKIFWMFFSYLLWGICYSGINIPYGSMASVISDKPKDRAQLSNWRTMGSTLGVTAIGVILPLFVYYKNEAGKTLLSGSRLSIAAVICSVAAVISYLICYHMTTERVKVERSIEKISFFHLLSKLIRNRALIGIVISSLLLLLAQLSLNNMGAYIYPNYFGNAAAFSVATMLGTILTFAFAPFIVKISEKIGKKELALTGSVISAAALFIAYFVHTHNIYVWMVLYGFGYVEIAIFGLICWAMITDVIDDTEIKTSHRTDGTVYSIYSFARKMGQAASAGITGVLLSLVGYTSATAFDTNVVNGIYDITCLIPAVGFILLALSLWLLYPLSKKTVNENVEKLRKIHNENKESN